MADSKLVLGVGWYWAFNFCYLFLRHTLLLQLDITIGESNSNNTK